MQDQTPISHPVSLWAASSQEDKPTDGTLADTVDVAVVGGGFTGLSTALHCAEKGLSVQVVEARDLGQGGSGRSVGLVNAGVWLPPREVRAQLGPVYGNRFLKQFGDGPRMVFDLIEKHQIRCEATQSGTIHAAHALSGLAGLRDRHAEWQAMGAPVELLDRDAVTALTGTAAFHGGLLDRRAGTVNPMGYCRGLARAARSASAHIATGVTATGLEKQPGGGWHVRTDRGDVRAGAVVLGTNAYTDTLWPGLAGTFSTIRFFQFATPPLGPDAARILPGQQGVWDTGRVMIALRRDRAGRVVIGCMGKLHGTVEAGLSRRWADRQIARLYPALKGIGFEEAWDGLIAMTPDHMPRIHNPDANLYTPIGYNGRGITTGTIFGQAMADLLTGMDPADLPLPISDAAPTRGGSIRSWAYQTAFTANQFLKGF